MKIKKCRNCKNNKLTKLFSLGKLSFTGKFPKNRNININKKKFIKIFICGGSQGAVSLNKILIDLFNKFPKNILDRIQTSIQCPDSQREEIKFSFDKN